MKITFNYDTFIKAFSSVAATTSTKETRPILQCVNMTFDFTSKTCRMISTDSAILSQAIVQYSRAEEVASGCSFTMNVYADDFIRKCKNFASKRELEITFSISQTNDSHVEVTLCGGSFTALLARGDFPVSDSITKPFEGALTNNQNTLYTIAVPMLEKIVKFAKQQKRDAIRLSIPHYDGIYIRPIAFGVMDEQDYTKVGYNGIVTPLRPRCN